MVVAPSFGCDRDCEMAERPANIVTTPNAVTAVRLVTGPAGRGVGIFECRTILSIRSMSMNW